MAYDEGLAQRIEEVLDETTGFEAKKMFGGVGYLLNGNMAVGVSGDGLMVRVGREGYDQALAEPHVGTFGPAGRTMSGWVTVAAAGIAEDAALRAWITRGVAVASSLPPK